MTPAEVTAFIKEKGIKLIDFKFADLLGTWQHFTTTLNEYSEDIFTDGLGFDGSSIRGWRAIHASDMLVIPDPATAWIDVFNAEPTLSLICTIQDPITREPYDRDPRGVAEKAEAYLKSTGIADTAYFGPEAEFFIFDDVRYDYSSNSSFHSVDSVEANLEHRARGVSESRVQDSSQGRVLPCPAGGYSSGSPKRDVSGIGEGRCSDRATAPRSCHCRSGRNRHPFFCAFEIMGDMMMYYKYILKNVAKKYNKVVTFMPKPLFGDNGSGMHTHSSLWKDGKPLFAGDKYAGLSEMALFYIGGILKHALRSPPSAIRRPTVTSDSFRDSRRRSTLPIPPAIARLRFEFRPIRQIPRRNASSTARPTRLQLRTCVSRPLLLAGLDGIQNRIDPGDPLDKNLYELPPEELAKVPTVPDSLLGAIEALEKDHEFLLKGDVFTKDFLDNWVELKKKEYDALRLRPHPYEFFMYFDL